MPRAKQRTPELRDHVLSVAVELLVREGVAGFTTRSVARQAGTSTPAVYELFGDKRGMVREVFFEGFRLLRRHFENLANSADPRSDLLQLGEKTDIPHVLVSLLQGLAAAENARRLGTSHESIDRRWALAVNAVLGG